MLYRQCINNSALVASISGLCFQSPLTVSADSYLRRCVRVTIFVYRVLLIVKSIRDESEIW